MRVVRFNSHTMVITKSPLLSVLTNYGSRSVPVVLPLTPAQTGYRPLIPVIDILSGHVFATDARGGLTVPIIAGQPRVFLPLSLHRGLEGEWAAVPGQLRIDTDVRTPGSASPGSPSKEGSRHGKQPSFGRMMSWLGMNKGGS
jgi:alpha-amylase